MEKQRKEGVGPSVVGWKIDWPGVHVGEGAEGTHYCSNRKKEEDWRKPFFFLFALTAALIRILIYRREKLFSGLRSMKRTFLWGYMRFLRRYTRAFFG